MANILDLQRTNDPRDIVHRTVQALVEGHVVGLPTETKYVLAAHALDEAAVGHLVDSTGFSPTSPLTLSVRSGEAAEDFFCHDSSLARRLSRRCWPGPLTMVVSCRDAQSAAHRLPDPVRSSLAGESQEISFRVVDHRVLSHLHRYLSAPLVIVDACRAGEPSPGAASEISEDLASTIPLLLDDGPSRYGGHSTVVRVSDNEWELLREGVIERAAMNQFVKPVIVLVCTGNTCRSPMAETMMRELLRKKFGCEDAVRVLSAGVAAGHGSGASPQAVEVMGHMGLDLTGHSSRPIDETVINVADLVLTMTRGHRDAILAAWPDMHDRVFTLRRDGGDITDPVGMPVETYKACAQQIESELSDWIQTLDEDFFPAATSEPAKSDDVEPEPRSDTK